MSCKTCPYPKVLCFAVYCKKDLEVRDLPASTGDIAGEASIQVKAPEWCPLALPTTATCPTSCA